MALFMAGFHACQRVVRPPARGWGFGPSPACRPVSANGVAVSHFEVFGASEAPALTQADFGERACARARRGHPWRGPWAGRAGCPSDRDNASPETGGGGRLQPMTSCVQHQRTAADAVAEVDLLQVRDALAGLDHALDYPIKRAFQHLGLALGDMRVTWMAFPSGHDDAAGMRIEQILDRVGADAVPGR